MLYFASFVLLSVALLNLLARFSIISNAFIRKMHIWSLHLTFSDSVNDFAMVEVNGKRLVSGAS